MNNLRRYEKDGVELVIDVVTGETFATQSGYARMSGIGKSTISRRIKGVASDAIKSAEINTEGGIQGVALIPEDLIVDWIVKDNPELAKKFMKVGVRVFLHELSGYIVNESPPTHYELDACEDSTHLTEELIARIFRETEIPKYPVDGRFTFGSTK